MKKQNRIKIWASWQQRATKLEIKFAYRYKKRRYRRRLENKFETTTTTKKQQTNNNRIEGHQSGGVSSAGVFFRCRDTTYHMGIAL